MQMAMQPTHMSPMEAGSVKGSIPWYLVPYCAYVRMLRMTYTIRRSEPSESASVVDFEFEDEPEATVSPTWSRVTSNAIAVIAAGALHPGTATSTDKSTQ